MKRKNTDLNTPGDPRYEPKDFASDLPILTDEELDKRIQETEAVARLAQDEGWQLILGGMKLRADQCYRRLATSKDWEEIRTLQCWLNIYNSLLSDMSSFLQRGDDDKKERQSRYLRVRDKIVDFLLPEKKKQGVA